MDDSAWDKIPPETLQETLDEIAKGNTKSRPYSEFRADVLKSIETGEPLEDIIKRSWAERDATAPSQSNTPQAH